MSSDREKCRAVVWHLGRAVHCTHRLGHPSGGETVFAFHGGKVGETSFVWHEAQNGFVTARGMDGRFVLVTPA